MKLKNLLLIGVVLAAILIPVLGIDTFNSVNVYRIAPDHAFIGQRIWVTLVFENSADTGKEIVVTEMLRDADFNTTDAKYIETEYGDKFWYYEWKIRLPAGENTSVVYWLNPRNVGTYVISPAKISVDGNNFYLKRHVIEIKCNQDGKCSSGENYLNCLEDCESWAADNICNPAPDDNCDLDCEMGVDSDCKKPGEITTSLNELAELISRLIKILENLQSILKGK